MTLEYLFEWLVRDTFSVMFYFFALPLLAFALNKLAKGRYWASPWVYMYSILVFITCLPGVFSVTLCAYTMFFDLQSLSEVNPIVHFVPVISLAITLLLIEKAVDVPDLPGFDRFSTLLFEIALTLVLMLFLERIEAWPHYITHLWRLVGVFLMLFGLIRLAGVGISLLRKRIK